VRLRLADEALAEVREAFEYYEAEAPGLGSEFAHALGLALRDIREHPEAWTRIRGGYRRHHARRFPYAIIFQLGPDFITVVAVAHHHRRPGYWKGRRADGSA
jgi:plasmid stabilization system protein ParE